MRGAQPGERGGADLLSPERGARGRRGAGRRAVLPRARRCAQRQAGGRGAAPPGARRAGAGAAAARWGLPGSLEPRPGPEHEVGVRNELALSDTGTRHATAAVQFSAAGCALASRSLCRSVSRNGERGVSFGVCGATERVRGRVLKLPVQPRGAAEGVPTPGRASPSEAHTGEPGSDAAAASGAGCGAAAADASTPDSSGREARPAADGPGADSAAAGGAAEPGPDPGFAAGAPGHAEGGANGASPGREAANGVADARGPCTPERGADAVPGAPAGADAASANGAGGQGGAGPAPASAPAIAERGARAGMGTIAYVDAGGKERRCGFAADQVCPSKHHVSGTKVVSLGGSTCAAPLAW